jgi:hypothetical protein
MSAASLCEPGIHACDIAVQKRLEAGGPGALHTFAAELLLEDGGIVSG